MNEISEPLNLSIALSIYFLTKIAFAEIISFAITKCELYWIPGIMSIVGMMTFLIVRPIFIDTRGSS